MTIAADISGLGLLQLRGPDSVRFLQGQLSADCRALSADRLLLAGLHTREGRVIAVLRLAAPDADTVLAILPRELVDTVCERLRKFVLRAKTQLTNATDHWQLTGFIASSSPGSGPPAGALAWPGSGTRWVRIDARTGNSTAAPPEASATLLEGSTAFRGADIADGLPQVYAATSEHFVSQMLNLDALGAIAFDKGCYTGQEVIARAHYRGRVKRRLQRFRAAVPVANLSPGTHGTMTDGRGFIVVDAVARSDGTSEFLAVAHSPATDTAGATGGTGAGATASASAHGAPIEAESLPLSYGLPPG